jgi:dTDP-4-dehydrorhamnose 3,5-epimerase
MNQLTLDDISTSVRGNIQSQQYEQSHIDGVRIVDLKTHITHDGAFSELLRIDSNGTLALFPEMQIAQINRSMMHPQTIKAWHLHFAQDEIWNVGEGTHILLGVWDVREHSSTKGASLVIPMTSSRLVYIPRGVAHGASNHTFKRAEILYIVSNQYNPEQPDERRLPWDSLGKEFWEPKKE